MRYELAHRVAALDAPTGPAGDVDRFISVLTDVVRFGTETLADWTKVDPVDADHAVRSCRLLARLEEAVPEVVNGPLVRDAQYWIATEKPLHLPPAVVTLAIEHFHPLVGNTPEFSTKPFGVGLYTSTGFRGRPGMWRAYLDLLQGSSLPPPTWHVWAVPVRTGARVLEIASAADWAGLVASFPTETGGLLYPDWPAVAEHCDGVHVTLRAITAMQGVCLRVPDGLTAPTFWDVETTFWLRWCFGSVRLAQVVRGSEGLSDAEP